jgi:hypothetical protein
VTARDADKTAQEALAALAECPPGGPWWYDGRDIFHNPEGFAGRQHLVVPLPETWHESQRVPDAVARLIVAAVNHFIALAAGAGAPGRQDGERDELDKLLDAYHALLHTPEAEGYQAWSLAERALNLCVRLRERLALHERDHGIGKCVPSDVFNAKVNEWIALKDDEQKGRRTAESKLAVATEALEQIKSLERKHGLEAAHGIARDTLARAAGDGRMSDPAELIAAAIERLRPAIEARLHAYCDEHDWEKLREWEMAGIATEEAAVELVQLARALVAVSADDCEHEWVDMRNEVVESGEWCRKCNTIRAGLIEGGGKGGGPSSSEEEVSSTQTAALNETAASMGCGCRPGSHDDTLGEIVKHHPGYNPWTIRQRMLAAKPDAEKGPN